MKKFHRLNLLLLVVFLTSLSSTSADASKLEDNPFLDYREIRISARSVETVDEGTIAWGQSLLRDLEVTKRTKVENARSILDFIHSTCKFSSSRPKTISDFLKSKKGNCYAHARLGAFLLRLAGIQAKFVYEVHLELKSAMSSIQARERGTGLFGHYHNDHFWIMFHDGTEWIPFDSALGIMGWEDFNQHKVTKPTKGVANPPFVVWADTDGGMTDMENITESFWQRMGARSIRGITESEWQPFLSSFYDYKVEDFRKPLSLEQEKQIASVARKFFSVPKIPVTGIDETLKPYFDRLEIEGNHLFLIEYDINSFGYKLLTENRFEESIAAFRLNVDHFPESFNAHDSLAEGFFKSGDFDKARKHYRISLELNPKNENAREMLAKIEENQSSDH